MDDKHNESCNLTIKRCPQCGDTPTLGYVCGEYFIYHPRKHIFECFCSSFRKMHSSERVEIDAWNKAVDEMEK